jgi:hypothetical protein
MQRKLMKMNEIMNSTLSLLYEWEWRCSNLSIWARVWACAHSHGMAFEGEQCPVYSVTLW